MPLQQLLRIAGRAAALAALALAAGQAAAHEVLHEIRRGQAVAVRVYESDGDPVAGVAWEVRSPAFPGKPWQTGRTDPAGWLAFVPDVPGRWQVRVIEPTGHGLDIAVETPPPAPAAATGSTSSPAPLAPASPGEAPPAAGVAFVLRPLLGIAVIGLVFAALFLAWRKKGAPPRG